MPDIEFTDQRRQRPRLSGGAGRGIRARRRSSCRSGGASRTTSARSATASPPRASSRWRRTSTAARRPTQPSEAEQKMMAMSMDQAETDMCGAASYLRSQPGVTGSKVGAVGFCLGGGLAVWAAAECDEIGAAVTFYYVMPHGKPDFTKHHRAGPGTFRHGRRIRARRGRQEPRSRAARGRRRRRVRLLRGSGPRLLQRHEPARHVRRRGSRRRLAADRRASCAPRSAPEASSAPARRGGGPLPP